MSEPTLREGNRNIQKILIVDDTTALLSLYEMVLTNEFEDRYEIVTSMNAFSALSYLKSLNNAEDILCVITDYEMMEMNGQDFSARLRELWEHLPIFLHTNTRIDEIPAIRERTQHLNITVLSKEDSMKSSIIPWIKNKTSKI